LAQALKRTTLFPHLTNGNMHESCGGGVPENEDVRYSQDVSLYEALR